ncbi:hypothetical protein NQ317_002807 [Molorchus minor]|uniref:Uncharacterized protein n=1 Tax=Molorchus minor TaxID=1323400 RepID=A0ABQ9JR47_9CUCU|nr:hypothetical protein NQ317_002807 [Molorchus minor]
MVIVSVCRGTSMNIYGLFYDNAVSENLKGSGGRKRVFKFGAAHAQLSQIARYKDGGSQNCFPFFLRNSHFFLYMFCGFDKLGLGDSNLFRDSYQTNP